MNQIQILSKPDDNVVAEGTLDLTSCELKIETQMDAEKFHSFSDAFFEDGKFKSDIISTCKKEHFKFGFLNRIIKEKGFLMKNIPLPKKPSLEDVDGGRRKTRKVKKSRKVRKSRKVKKSRKSRKARKSRK
jgi:hypothetical protein